MLKFFRQIRQKQLAEGKLSRYLIYAVGEILLVMIGILLALQVNNWNESRKTKEAIKVHLQNLIADLKDDQVKLAEIKDRCTFQFSSLQYLLKMEGSFDENELLQDLPSFEGNSI